MAWQKDEGVPGTPGYKKSLAGEAAMSPAEAAARGYTWVGQKSSAAYRGMGTRPPTAIEYQRMIAKKVAAGAYSKMDPRSRARLRKEIERFKPDLRDKTLKKLDELVLPPAFVVQRGETPSEALERYTTQVGTYETQVGRYESKWDEYLTRFKDKPSVFTDPAFTVHKEKWEKFISKEGFTGTEEQYAQYEAEWKAAKSKQEESYRIFSGESKWLTGRAAGFGTAYPQLAEMAATSIAVQKHLEKERREHPGVIVTAPGGETTAMELGEYYRRVNESLNVDRTLLAYKPPDPQVYSPLAIFTGGAAIKQYNVAKEFQKNIELLEKSMTSQGFFAPVSSLGPSGIGAVAGVAEPSTKPTPHVERVFVGPPSEYLKLQTAYIDYEAARAKQEELYALSVSGRGEAKDIEWGKVIAARTPGWKSLAEPFKPIADISKEIVGIEARKGIPSITMGSTYLIERKVAPYLKGIYEGVREKPFQTAVTTAAFFALPGTIKGLKYGLRATKITQTIGKIPKVGGLITKYTEPVIGGALGTAYAVSVGARLRAVPPEMRMEEFGRITGTELLPMGVGGYVGLKALGAIPAVKFSLLPKAVRTIAWKPVEKWTPKDILRVEDYFIKRTPYPKVVERFDISIRKELGKKLIAAEEAPLPVWRVSVFEKPKITRIRTTDFLKRRTKKIAGAKDALEGPIGITPRRPMGFRDIYMGKEPYEVPISKKIPLSKYEIIKEISETTDIARLIELRAALRLKSVSKIEPEIAVKKVRYMERWQELVKPKVEEPVWTPSVWEQPRYKAFDFSKGKPIGVAEIVPRRGRGAVEQKDWGEIWKQRDIETAKRIKAGQLQVQEMAGGELGLLQVLKEVPKVAVVSAKAEPVAVAKLTLWQRLWRPIPLAAQLEMPVILKARVISSEKLLAERQAQIQAQIQAQKLKMAPIIIPTQKQISLQLARQVGVLKMKVLPITATIQEISSKLVFGMRIVSPQKLKMPVIEKAVMFTPLLIPALVSSEKLLFPSPPLLTEKKKKKRKAKKKKQWEWLEEVTVQRPEELRFGALGSGIPKVSKVKMLTMEDITSKPPSPKKRKKAKTVKKRKNKPRGRRNPK